MADRSTVMEVVGAGLAVPLGGRQELELEGGGASIGDLVLARRTAAGRACVESVLAREGTARAAMVRTVVEAGLLVAFPPAVEAEVAAVLEAPGIDDPALEDMTDLPFVTIDGEGARDLDQAVFIARVRGGYDVRYAIADASWFVRPGSALFAEALARGASFYVPGVVVPMLPRALSEGIVSLGPGVDRRALVLSMQVDAAGRCSAASFQRARIRSRAALSFGQVQRWYDTPEVSDLGGAVFCESLALLREVGRLRLVEARQRDVVSYQRAELDIRLGAEGFGFSVVADVRTEVELYNEQISLLCNVEGARVLAERGAHAAWRVHPAPPDGRLAELERLIAGVVAEHRLDPSVWRWRRRRTPADSSGIPLGDYLSRIREVPGSERPRAAIERAAMTSNARSVFASEPGPHHGIGAALYARLSAPMRELVGVHTHAQAVEVTMGAPWSEPISGDVLDVVIDAANRARERQRVVTKAANRVVIDHLLAQDLRLPVPDRSWRRGTVVELRPTRAYVQLDEPPIELKVYGEDLGTDPHLFRGGAAMDLGPHRRLRVGGAVDIRVVGFEERAARWRFDLRVVTGGRRRRSS